MVKVNVIGSAGWPKDHELKRCKGEMWISISTAIAVYEHRDGAVVLWENGGSLLVDDDPETLVSKRPIEA